MGQQVEKNLFLLAPEGVLEEGQKQQLLQYPKELFIRCIA
jgi:hypothetical protein